MQPSLQPRRKNTDPLQGHPRYQKIKDLNKGTFGFVQLAYDVQTGLRVAIKFIERGDKVTKYTVREVLNHKRLVHPHIVEMKEVFLTPDYLAIVMEFATGGDMFQLVVANRGLPEQDARWYFQQLIIAVDYCHRMGVANRDIKLENTLLDGTSRPLIKICDFGYSKHEKFQSEPGSRVGTPAYLAPEVILTTRGKTYDGKVADVWSCGVMLFIMLAAAYPFGRPEDEQLKPSKKMHVMLQEELVTPHFYLPAIHPEQLAMLQRILNVEYSLPSRVNVSPECRDLLSKLLVADPRARIPLGGIWQHPWFQKDLPEGVAAMNSHLLAHPATFDSPGDQSMDETEEFVRQAMKASNIMPMLRFDNDDFIDSAIAADAQHQFRPTGRFNADNW